MKEGETYEDILEFKTVKTFMEERLEDYNMEPGVIGMDLVLFRDAIEHGMDKFCCFLRISQFLDLGIVLPASYIDTIIQKITCMFSFSSYPNYSCDRPTTWQHASGGDRWKRSPEFSQVGLLHLGI